jgi:hypothetical protein
VCFDIVYSRRRTKASAVIRHNPIHLPYWPNVIATSEKGCFGRLRWINSEPSEQLWGRLGGPPPLTHATITKRSQPFLMSQSELLELQAELAQHKADLATLMLNALVFYLMTSPTAHRPVAATSKASI